MIETRRLTLHPVAPHHAAGLRAYYERNQAHLARWEPARADDFFTTAFWERFVANAVDDARNDRAYRFLAFERADEARVVAQINLQHVVRGVFLGAQLGYSVDAGLEGRGYATEAVGACVAYAFETLRLHRVTACYHPTNERSGRLLRRLGFTVEGYARDYLFINGGWGDSVLTARVNDTMTSL